MRPVDLSFEHPERIDPELTNPIDVQTHVERYRFACTLAHGRVLDLGCGAGYGSSILAAGETISAVVGVDISAEAVVYANRSYNSARTSFLRVDVGRLPFADASFDFTTCFEVIEHVDNPRGLLSEIRRVLRPGGRVVISSPNKLMSSPFQRVPPNPFHKTEWYRDELAELLSEYFLIEEAYGQMCYAPMRGLIRAFLLSREVYPWLMKHLREGRSQAIARLTGVRPQEYVRIRQMEWPRWTFAEGGHRLPVTLIFLCGKPIVRC